MQAARAFALTGGLLLHFYEVTNGCTALPNPGLVLKSRSAAVSLASFGEAFFDEVCLLACALIFDCADDMVMTVPAVASSTRIKNAAKRPRPFANIFLLIIRVLIVVRVARDLTWDFLFMRGNSLFLRLLPTSNYFGSGLRLTRTHGHNPGGLYLTVNLLL